MSTGHPSYQRLLLNGSLFRQNTSLLNIQSTRLSRCPQLVQPEHFDKSAVYFATGHLTKCVRCQYVTCALI